MTPDLESMLIVDMACGNPVELERALLIVSGADTEKQIAEYKRKLDSMQESFSKYISELQKPKRQIATHTAKALHRFLWDSRPERYNDDYLLTDVIDSQLDYDPEKAVGDCLGLTSLYTVLGQRCGLNLFVLDLPEHVGSILIDNGMKRIIECTERDKFCFSMKGYAQEYELAADQLCEAPPKSLVAFVLFSRGYDKGHLKDYLGAIADYDTVIWLMPDFADAYQNRAEMEVKIGEYADALADFDKALELYPQGDAEAYKCRGELKQEMGDYAGAVADFKAALKIDPDYLETKNLLHDAELNLNQGEKNEC
jgi:tetratricopeptide (TPR) repeat protein